MAYLMFDDGKIFKGLGLTGECCGECVVYTANLGQQDILCNPAISGKIVLFTFPHVGICGAYKDGLKSVAAGVLGRNFAQQPASSDCSVSFNDFLIENDVPRMQGIDPRPIALYIKQHGPQLCAMAETPERCAHLLRFASQDEMEFMQESTLYKTTNTALIDMGLSAKDKDVLQKKIKMDIYNPDTNYDEISDYDYYLFCGGDERAIPIAEQLCRVLLSYKKAVVGVEAGHALLAKTQGWDINKSRSFICQMPIKQESTGKIYFAWRRDFFEISGRGMGRAMYKEADQTGKICALSYYKDCFSQAFKLDEYDELKAWLDKAGVEQDA